MLIISLNVIGTCKNDCSSTNTNNSKRVSHKFCHIKLILEMYIVTKGWHNNLTLGSAHITLHVLHYTLNGNTSKETLLRKKCPMFVWILLILYQPARREMSFTLVQVCFVKKPRRYLEIMVCQYLNTCLNKVPKTRRRTITIIIPRHVTDTLSYKNSILYIIYLQ